MLFSATDSLTTRAKQLQYGQCRTEGGGAKRVLNHRGPRIFGACNLREVEECTFCVQQKTWNIGLIEISKQK